MKLLERMAMAMWQAEQAPSDIVPAPTPPEAAHWTSYLPTARKVLEAMKEPTEKMLSVDPTRPSGFFYPEDVWRAMVEAGLEE